jgi:hypothetical protein
MFTRANAIPVAPRAVISQQPGLGKCAVLGSGPGNPADVGPSVILPVAFSPSIWTTLTSGGSGLDVHMPIFNWYPRTLVARTNSTHPPPAQRTRCRQIRLRALRQTPPSRAVDPEQGVHHRRIRPGRRRDSSPVPGRCIQCELATSPPASPTTLRLHDAHIDQPWAIQVMFAANPTVTTTPANCAYCGGIHRCGEISQDSSCWTS